MRVLWHEISDCIFKFNKFVNNISWGGKQSAEGGNRIHEHNNHSHG